uniref:Uncharacterized protein n=1 Tax=viral metagenome TaxID=1070528 RepID=A0A6C0KLY5_9ZZZZ
MTIYNVAFMKNQFLRIHMAKACDTPILVANGLGTRIDSGAVLNKAIELVHISTMILAKFRNTLRKRQVHSDFLRNAKFGNRDIGIRSDYRTG